MKKAKQSFQSRQSKLKSEFLQYYRKLPVQKLAAEFIGKDEDTITNWKKVDKRFSDQLLKAKSEWALEKVRGVRSTEWLLERILKEYFAVKTNVQLDTNRKLDDALSRMSKLLPPAGE